MNSDPTLGMDNQHANAFVIVGQFIMGCGVFEQNINYLVEQNFDSKTQIDRAQELPVLERWQSVKESVPSHLYEAMDANGIPIKDKIAEIDEIVDFFKNHIKATRDILAHSSLATFDDSKIWINQSRRHRMKGKDLLDPLEVLKLSGDFYPHQTKLLKLSLQFGRHGTGWQSGVDRSRPTG